MRRWNIFFLFPLLLFLSCGFLFLRPKFGSEKNLSMLFAGFVIAHNHNLANQILLDKNITLLREGETISLNVTLSKFVGDGKIYIRSDNPSIEFNGVANSSLQFLEGNISIPQKIEIFVKEDENNRNEISTIEVGGVSYAVLTQKVEVKDNDSQRILTYNAPPTLEEGKSAEFRVKLNTKPDTTVTVNLSPSDSTSLTTDKSVLTFTPDNYSTEQTVNLTAPEDSDSTSETSAINLTMTGAENTVLTVKVVDNDIMPVFNLSSVSLNEGGTTTVTVQLNGEPGIDKTIFLNSSIQSSMTVSPSTLNFTTTNWNLPQTVTLTGVQDTNYESELITLSAASIGLTTGSISVTVVDDEIQTVIFTGPTQVLEGQSITIGVSLSLQPSFNKTVTLSLSSPILQSNPTSFTFTPANYNTPKNLTITAIANDGNENSEMVSLTASASSMADSIYSILVIDKDTRIVFSNPSSPFNEGGSGSIQISLSGDPGIPRTVTATSSRISFGGAVSFDSSNWNILQTLSATSTSDTNCISDAILITGSGTGLVSGIYNIILKDNDIGISNGVKFFLPFNGNINDESGNGYTVLNNGAISTADRFNYKDRAYSFDGVDDYMEVSDDPIFDLDGDATLSAWVMPSSIPPVGMTIDFPILSKDEGIGDLRKWIWSLENGKMIFHINHLPTDNGATTGGYSVSSDPFPISVGTFYYLALVKSGSTISFYLNGNYVGGGTLPNPIISPISAPLRIGFAETNYILHGKVDDVRVYNTLLTATDLLELYNDTCPVKKSCRELLDDSLSVGDGGYIINPDGNTTGSPYTAYCDMTNGWTYKNVVNGTATRTLFDYDSCNMIGMKVFAPESKTNYESGRDYMVSLGRPHELGPLGVYRGSSMPAQGIAMNSANAGAIRGWASTAGTSWWISDRNNISEPNGDYNGYCWLGIWYDDSGNVAWYNDQRCDYVYTNYLCDIK